MGIYSFPVILSFFIFNFLFLITNLFFKIVEYIHGKIKDSGKGTDDLFPLVVVNMGQAMVGMTVIGYQEAAR